MPDFSKFFNYIYSSRNLVWQKIKDYFFEITSYLFVKIYLIILLIINLLIWYVAQYIYKAIESEQIALHANIDFGIDYYGSSKEIFILPLMGLMVVLINFILAACFSRNKDRFFIFHLLLFSGILINLILLAAIISVYYINFK
jgi:hypothetical protein